MVGFAANCTEKIKSTCYLPSTELPLMYIKTDNPRKNYIIYTTAITVYGIRTPIVIVFNNVSS